MDEISQRTICGEWGFTIKDLYRSGYLLPKEDCTYSSLSEEDISCGFECGEDTLDDISTKLRWGLLCLLCTFFRLYFVGMMVCTHS